MPLPQFDHPWVDETYSPILICHGLTKATDAGLKTYLARLEWWTRAAQDPYSWVICPGALTPPQRKLMTETQSRLQPLMKAHQVALAFVVINPLIKAVMQAVFWVAPPAVEYKICASFAEAFAHVARCHPAALAEERGLLADAENYARGR